jgi:alginate O-acetyltransferase complex protein AlgJ
MRVRHIITVVAIVFFSLPMVLRVVGVRAERFENHALAPAPKLSQGWDVFPQATQFFTDRMPLREQAVNADRNISETVFGTNPLDGTHGSVAPGGAAGATPGANIVTIGRSGWLYATESLVNICKANRPITIAQANAAWGALQRSLERPGKRVLVVVVPDKDDVYPEYLPKRYPQKDCLPKDRDELWRGIDGAGKDFVALRRPLTAAKKTSHQPLYLRRDSHWNEIGASYFPREVLKKLGGNTQVKTRDFRYGSEDRISDLEKTLDFKHVRPEQVPRVDVVRSTRAPKVPGQTVLVGDSFSSFLGQMMPQYFDHYNRLDWLYARSGASDKLTNDVAKILVGADTVIFEVGERSYLQMAKPLSANPAGPTGVVVTNINRLTQAIRSLPQPTAPR